MEARYETRTSTHVPGETEAERFDNAVRKMFTVSKEDLTRKELEWKRARTRKKRPNKST